MTFATAWQWPVLPGAGLGHAARTGGARPGTPDPTLPAAAGPSAPHTATPAGPGRPEPSAAHARPPATSGAAGAKATGPRGRGCGCGCPDPECSVPGAHPFDPGLLAATTDARMIRWWWTNRPSAPIVLATGGAAPCAVSLPAEAGARALAALDHRGMRVGPVVATPERWAVLVAPYSLERLGELLYAKAFVPGSLRFHGDGGYLALPPSRTGAGEVRWERGPLPGSAAPWLPDVEAVVDAMVDALTRTGVSAPEL
ncbi:DNA primase [Streptomyces tsukubensis]|uniref:DNA primase n=1 Tax=Streptomyces tsukubensis TaxID=83656 RepID=A0A1V4A8S5_9ACTN|nr:DNA primase [Streptomyces tsukubensis]